MQYIKNNLKTFPNPTFKKKEEKNSNYHVVCEEQFEFFFPNPKLKKQKQKQRNSNYHVVCKE